MLLTAGAPGVEACASSSDTDTWPAAAADWEASVGVCGGGATVCCFALLESSGASVPEGRPLGARKWYWKKHVRPRDMHNGRWHKEHMNVVRCPTWRFLRLGPGSVTEWRQWAHHLLMPGDATGTWEYCGELVLRKITPRGVDSIFFSWRVLLRSGNTTSS